MSLAGGREPRKTAGNRMSKLLDAEEEDEFYKTTYGGFNDVSNPASFSCLKSLIQPAGYYQAVRTYGELSLFFLLMVKIILSVYNSEEDKCH